MWGVEGEEMEGGLSDVTLGMMSYWWNSNTLIYGHFAVNVVPSSVLCAYVFVCVCVCVCVGLSLVQFMQLDL